MGDDEKRDSTVRNEAQPEIAAAGGNLPETTNSIVTLRLLCDEHAKLVAAGEHEIQAFLGGLFVRFQADAAVAVKLERGQCELLLRLRRQIPHGRVTEWKRDLAANLNDGKHKIGRRFGVSTVEERLGRAEQAEAEPGYWTRMEAQLLVTNSLDFRRASKLLKGAEEHEKPKQPTGGKDDKRSAGEGDGGGGDPDPDDEDDDDGVDEDPVAPPTPVEDAPEVESIPVAELQQLRADVDAADKVEDERNALRAEVEILKRRIAELEDQWRSKRDDATEGHKWVGDGKSYPIICVGGAGGESTESVTIPSGAIEIRAELDYAETDDENQEMIHYGMGFSFLVPQKPGASLPSAEAESEPTSTTNKTGSHDVH